MKRYILLFAALCGICFSANAQSLERTVCQRLRSFFKNYETSYAEIGVSKLDSFKIDHEGKVLRIYANAVFGYQSFTEENTSAIYRSLKQVLPGPVNYYSFELKMKKVRRILNEREGSSLVLFVKGEMRRIPVKSILYVEIRDHNLCYHTDDGDFSLTGSMKKLEEQLAPHSFARCNNCYLVNLMHVRTVTPEQVFVENTPLKISRPRRKAFMEALSAYYGGGGR